MPGVVNLFRCQIWIDAITVVDVVVVQLVEVVDAAVVVVARILKCRRTCSDQLDVT